MVEEAQVSLKGGSEVQIVMENSPIWGMSRAVSNRSLMTKSGRFRYVAYRCKDSIGGCSERCLDVLLSAG